MQFSKEFYALSDIPKIDGLELTNNITGNKHLILNLPGKQASVKIFYAISSNHNFQISATQAQIGLNFYGEYVQQEQCQPRSHPNIRLLLDTIAQNCSWSVKVL